MPGLLKQTFGFATIRDVARLAGVSIATVSAVINGRIASAQDATSRRRGDEALDYHPDPWPGQTGRSKVVGSHPDLTNPFFVELMCGVEETARYAGYSVIFSNSNENPAQERENLAMLHSQPGGRDRSRLLGRSCRLRQVDDAPFPYRVYRSLYRWLDSAEGRWWSITAARPTRRPGI